MTATITVIITTAIVTVHFLFFSMIIWKWGMGGHSVGSKEHLGQHRKSRIRECRFLACLEEEWDQGDKVHDSVKVA